MRLFEFEGKELFEQAGISLSKRVVVDSVE